jgi:hypothetical protein
MDTVFNWQWDAGFQGFGHGLTQGVVNRRQTLTPEIARVKRMGSQFVIPCCSSILVLDLTVPAFLVLHMEHGTIFGLALTPVVEPGGGDIGMTQPLLDLGDVGCWHSTVFWTPDAVARL